MPDRASTELPPARRRRPRKDIVQYVTRVLCALLAIIGTLPFGAAILVSSPWVKHWAASKSEEVLRDQGINATYDVSLRVWPLAVELDDIMVAGTDGQGPALTATRATVRPKVFGLLAGKLAIDQIEVDAPKIRVVVADGKIENLDLKLPEKKSDAPAEPLRAPFNVFSVTDADVSFMIDRSTHGEAHEIDLDVTAVTPQTGGSAFEVALRTGHATVHNSRTYGDPAAPKLAIDDDVICSLDARVRYEPGLVTVRRLSANGAADLDVAENDDLDPKKSCDLPEDDRQRVELELNHLHVYLPEAGAEGAAKMPRVDGHVRVRAPLGLAERQVSLPETDGWVSVDADVRYAEDTAIPDISGRIAAKNIRLAQYNFAQAVDADVMVRNNIVTSQKTRVWLGDGLVELSDVQVEPLAPGGVLRKATLDITSVDFTTLLRNLGIHPHSYVGWKIDKVHSPLVTGTFAPLKIDFDFTGNTHEFGVYDRPAEDPSRKRIFGFSQAKLASHLAVRSDGVHFQAANAEVGDRYTSRLSNANVTIGFHNELHVDAVADTVDLEDISPIGPVKMDGIVKAEARVEGSLKQPMPTGKIESIKDLEVGDVRFGDVGAGTIEVDVKGPSVDLAGLAASVRGSSDYEVPTAHLDFGGSRGFVVDAFADAGARAGSHGLRLVDLLWMFNLDEDPRYQGIDAHLRTSGARVHVALGGPEDKCNSGYIEVNAKADLSNISLFGESFVDGNADIALQWADRDRGIAGAEISVRSFLLRKSKLDGRSLGTILGSAQIHEGGALSGNIVVDGLELAQLDSLGAMKSEIEGRVSAVAQIDGMLDDFSRDKAPGFTVQAEAQVSPIRVHRVPLPGSSSVRLTMRNDIKRLGPKDAVGTSHCGAQLGPAFDKVAYENDTSKQGYFRVDGDVLDRQIHLANVVLTREKSPVLSGSVQLTDLDLGPLARIGAYKADEADARDSQPIEGTLNGTLVLQQMPLQNLAATSGQFYFGDGTVLRRGDARVAVVKPDYPILIVGDSITVGSSLDLILSEAQGFSGKVSLVGGVTELSQKNDAHLALQATLTPLSLDALTIVLPQIERASGTIEGSALVTGTVATPIIDGKVSVRATELLVKGLPAPLTNVALDVRASARSLSARGSADVGGGTVALNGDVPLEGLKLGFLDASLTARDIHVAPAEGIAATADADLHVTVDPGAPTTVPQGKLPHVSGAVLVTAFAYTRPVNLSSELSFSGSKRTQADSPDPALDSIVFNVAVRSRVPLAIKNDLAELAFGIDGDAITVTGTNQRVALTGNLRALPNGQLHFQGNTFDVEQAVIQFNDQTRIAANVDVTAKTEYRRYTDSTAAGAASTGGAASSAGGSHSGALWRITLHAWGDSDDLHLDLTSDPALSQEDIVLLLTVGMTRAELDQLQASSLGATLALNYLGTASGADQVVKKAIPVIDDFRFGSGYSTLTFKSEPQLTIGKRLTDNLHASITTGLVAEDPELRSNIEWRLSNQMSVSGSYDNIDTFASSTIGNIGVDLRWRLDFE